MIDPTKIITTAGTMETKEQYQERVNITPGVTVEVNELCVPGVINSYIEVSNDVRSAGPILLTKNSAYVLYKRLSK